MHMQREGFLYAGLIAEIASQRHSVLLYVALDEREFGIETGGGTLRASAALVGPGVRKRILGRPQLAVLDVSPTHPDYPAFAQAASESAAPWPREHFEPLMPALHEFRAGRMRVDEADRLYAQMVALAVKRLPATRPVDPRVREVMKLLRENRRRSLDELAEAVCLSKDWLVHLFQREAGISLRKYEQTIKLHAAAAFVNRGVSMTQVAAIAGFADSAHFSKMWKQHYGLPPNRMFSGHEYVTVDPLHA
ncbi:AraC family transcriptional regulator [Piscinibacter sp. HJYY11]|uniref:helix-turn-helix domain-containing protein n=1 Tax=Piscinibacter sp. HJYY11 TaxID=2801333 RepID=UPI00191D4DBA|nr:AraC family transcriptional regulator [Piscinibacter sp. HJYY11]MBL0730070.1 helix-turn-helix transcriptional regulator [Piscinibacter sp. HJYY11]